MAISKFTHSIRVVKGLAAAVALMTIAGTAQAQCPSYASDAEFARCERAAGFEPSLHEAPNQSDAVNRMSHERYLALLASRLTAQEVASLSLSRAVPIDPVLYGGLPDAADPAELRKHRQLGAREDTANNTRKGPEEIPLCVGNCR
jgi:hypothetical protein